jgi:hypothetical protein
MQKASSVGICDWGLKMERMTQASVGTDPWTVGPEQASSCGSRNGIYSSGLVVPPIVRIR